MGLWAGYRPHSSYHRPPDPHLLHNPLSREHQAAYCTLLLFVLGIEDYRAKARELPLLHLWLLPLTPILKDLTPCSCPPFLQAGLNSQPALVLPCCPLHGTGDTTVLWLCLIERETPS